MNDDDIRGFTGKQIKLRLKNGFFYSGKILSVNGDSFKFTDKFGLEMLVAFDAVASIEELGGTTND